MLEEELPMLRTSETESSDEELSEVEEMEEENEESSADEDQEDLPEKFDLSKLKQRMEEGPASSSDEDEDDDEDEKEESSEDEEAKGVSGWADAMAKVLNTGKNTESNKPLLLSKAKKDQQQLQKVEDETKPKEKAAVRREKKKEWEEKNRRRPDIVKDRLKEKKLARVATRGVVQLFNAVREQQKALKTQLNKAGLSTTKRDKVFKNLDKDSFLQVLEGKKNLKENNTAAAKKTVTPKIEVKTEDDDGTWNVLKDNFMMGAKMRDWDKESDSE